MKRHIILIAAVLVFWSCKSENKFRTTPSGLEYCFKRQNNNEQMPNLKDVLELDIKIYSNDSLIFSSSQVSTNFRLEQLDTSKGLIYEALMMMHVGDSAHFKINAANFYIKTAQFPVPNQIKPNEKLLFVVRLDNILTAEQVQKEKERNFKINKRREQQALEQFFKLTDKQFNKICDRIYISTNQNLTGQKPKDKDTVEIIYSLKVVNINEIGRPIVKSKKLSFVVGDTNIIEGLNIAIKELPLKSKSCVVIPSELAYGEKGWEDLIAPFSSLVFDIEILSIKSYR